MSGYGEDYRDMQEARRLNKWAPLEDIPQQITPERYRFILANLRETQAELKKIKDALRAFKGVL